MSTPSSLGARGTMARLAPGTSLWRIGRDGVASGARGCGAGVGIAARGCGPVGTGTRGCEPVEPGIRAGCPVEPATRGCEPVDPGMRGCPDVLDAAGRPVVGGGAVSRCSWVAACGIDRIVEVDVERLERMLELVVFDRRLVQRQSRIPQPLGARVGRCVSIGAARRCDGDSRSIESEGTPASVMLLLGSDSKIGCTIRRA